MKWVISFLMVLSPSLYACANEGIFEISDPMCQTDKVGGKAATLHQLFEAGIHIPKGFVISTKIFDGYLASIEAYQLLEGLETLSDEWSNAKNDPLTQKSLEREIEKVAEAMQTKILQGHIPTSDLQAIENYYTHFTLEATPLVAVRSSATAEDMQNIAFAGQYESYLNQQGIKQIEEAVKKVWASAFTMKVINYRNRNGISHRATKMGVLIQQMVQAYSSGRGYSVDIEFGLPLITIKNLYGLGEGEASGLASPDTWIIDPNTLSIIKRRLGTKKCRIECDAEKNGSILLENSPSMQKKFAISFSLAKKLALEIQKIGEIFLKKGIPHVEIEYAFTEEGELYITQARPETSWKEPKTFPAIDPQKIEGDHPLLLEGGNMGWGGIATGTLRVLKTLEEAQKADLKGAIIVLGDTTNAWENIMVASSGLISEEDITSSHAVSTSREEKIPSFVGHPNAKKALEPYDGQLVTLDATLKRIYLGDIPSSAIYYPSILETSFQSSDNTSEEEQWISLLNLNLMSTDASGFKWLSRPVAGTQQFLHRINSEAYDWIAKKIDLPPIQNKRVEGDNFQISFTESHSWRELLRTRDLKFFESFYNERLKINAEYLQASLYLDYTPESLQKWIDSATHYFGFQSVSFNIGKITDGLLNEELANKKLEEPYLSQVRPAMEALYGSSLSKERVKLFKAFLLEMDRTPLLVAALREVASGSLCAKHILQTHFFDFYNELEQYAKNYRVIEAFAIDFSEEWLLKPIADQLLKEFDAKTSGRHLADIPTCGEEFFPDDALFQRVARLAVLNNKLKLDTHHLRCRGYWKFREFMAPVGDFLIAKGVISNFSEIFDHEPSWLVDQFAKYREEMESLKEKRLENCPMIPYISFFLELNDVVLTELEL